MKYAKLKITVADLEKIEKIIYSRYPDQEWGAAFQFGFHADPNLGLLMTLCQVVEPGDGDLNHEVENVQFLEPFILRLALAGANNLFGVGIIHSHPEGYGVRPSWIDDDMDGHFKDYFGDFAPDRPYASLIFSRDAENVLRISGRVFFREEWFPIETTIVGKTLKRFPENLRSRRMPEIIKERLKRLSGIYGKESVARLWNSTAVVMGVGGTGSAAAHSLARSCVGRIVLVDTDVIAPSNAERVHGCEAGHIVMGRNVPKVEILKALIKRINPDIEVVAIQGNCLQPDVYEELIHADIVLGCTDTNHGRAALGELAYLHLVPGLQVNVSMEADAALLTGQVIQFTRYLPGQPCAYCRDQVDTHMMAQEFMADEERERRAALAAEAIAKGTEGDAYWKAEPVLLTVGAVTTMAGEFAAHFAVGALTDRFGPSSNFFEMNLLAENLGVASMELRPSSECQCSTRIGHSNQNQGGRIHLAPSHWKKPIRS